MDPLFFQEYEYWGSGHWRSKTSQGFLNSEASIRKAVEMETTREPTDAEKTLVQNLLHRLREDATKQFDYYRDPFVMAIRQPDGTIKILWAPRVQTMTVNLKETP